MRKATFLSESQVFLMEVGEATVKVVFRPATKAERMEFVAWQQELATESGDGAATVDIASRMGKVLDVLAQLVQRIDGLVSDGAAVTLPEGVEARADLLSRFDSSTVGDMFAFVSGHCFGLDVETEGN